MGLDESHELFDPIRLGLPVRSAAVGAAVREGGHGAVRAATPELECSGQPIGAYDMLIGCPCPHLGPALVTNNRRGFDRVSGLRESWL